MAAAERSGKAPSRIAAKRRRQIVEATMRSIVDKGLSGTTLASVAKEAGLSQGVAVFYFHSKLELLTEVLRHLYDLYEAAWQQAVADAGPRALDRLLALVRIDFSPEVCSPEYLIVWHAFWGEASARPHYAGITDDYDDRRFTVLRAACAALLAESGKPEAEAEDLATAIDSLTDGLWLRIYLSADTMSRRRALELLSGFLAANLPDHAEEISAGLLGPA